MKKILSACALLVVLQALAGCIIEPEPYGGHGYYEHHCGWRCR